MTRNRLTTLLATFALCLVASAARAEERDRDERDGERKKTVTLSGVTYVFNTPYLLPGATISIAELPALSTTSGADGRFSLAVPDESKITPVVSAPGFRTMHLQTFETDGDDLKNVFVQAVPFEVYYYLSLMLGLDPFGPACNVVTTVSVAAIQGLTYEQFRAYGAHGQAGATVTSKPALAGPIYFNEQVLPDPSRSATSNDGGVLFLNVPAGEHVLRASAPGHKFAKAVVNCAAGRFINAAPPYGLWEKK